MWPSIIPGREAVVFVTTLGQPRTTGELAVLDLPTREVTRLGLAGVSPHYVSTGHLVYAAEDGSVRAVPFDSASLEVTGNPVPLVEGVVVKNSGAANFSISDSGRLAYASGAGGGVTERSLVWVDREGREELIAAPPRTYVYPRLSPDGTRLTLDSRDDDDDVWIWDLVRGGLTRFIDASEANRFGIWTPDGNRIIFSSTRDGSRYLYWRAADGTGTVERLTESPNTHWPNSVAPDRSRLVFWEVVDGNSDLHVLTLDDEHRVEPLIVTEFNERNGEISPDGRWLAYESDASGQRGIYVQPFPDVDTGRWPISTTGGTRPVWGPEGRELFYLTEAGVMGVTIDTSADFQASAPTLVIEGSYYGPPTPRGQDRRRRHGGGVSSQRHQARPGRGAQGLAASLHR